MGHHLHQLRKALAGPGVRTYAVCQSLAQAYRTHIHRMSASLVNERKPAHFDYIVLLCVPRREKYDCKRILIKASPSEDAMGHRLHSKQIEQTLATHERMLTDTDASSGLPTITIHVANVLNAEPR